MERAISREMDREGMNVRARDGERQREAKRDKERERAS